MNKIKVIAEVGWNHCGDMELASKMVMAAKESGADYVKFQTWSVNRLTPGPWDHDGRRQIYEKAELSADQHQKLQQLCLREDIGFLTSCFSASDVDLALPFLDDSIKIPSTEIANKELLEKIASSKLKTVFLSCGASTVDEIETAVKLLFSSGKIIHLLHCVSMYPCSPDQANLPRISQLRSFFGRYVVGVGYSGHCDGVYDAIASCQYSPTVIEKHFTIDKNLPGRDNKFALLPHEMKILTTYVHQLHDLTRFRGIEYLDGEKGMREDYRGRWDNGK